MTFAQILRDTAGAFLVAGLDVEQVTYLKWQAGSISGGDAATMAAGGVLTGTPTAGAVAGTVTVAGGAGFVERTISALVTRERPRGIAAAPHGQAPVVTVRVKNDGASGISATEVDTGRDMIRLPVWPGETPMARPIAGIISQDEGMIGLRLR
jgi:hypothetical protein